MNRLATWKTETNSCIDLPPSPTSIHSFPSKPTSSAKAVFVPLKYEAKHAYPLLIWLHDDGENESSIRDAMPAISLRNFLGAGPRGNCNSTDSNEAGTTLAWRQSLDGIQDASDSVEDCIATISARYKVEESMIFVAGWGSGGTMALRLAFRNPTRFAGCISLGGAFPEDHFPLRKINQSRGLSVLLANSEDFLTYDTDRFCSDVRLMYLAGANLHVRQYPTSDQTRKLILGDVNRWMMSIVTNQDLFQTTDVPLIRPDQN